MTCFERVLQSEGFYKSWGRWLGFFIEKAKIEKYCKLVTFKSQARRSGASCYTVAQEECVFLKRRQMYKKPEKCSMPDELWTNPTYCWGYANAVDKGKEEEFLKNICDPEECVKFGW